ncbi:MAG: Uma2 family endonuclease [Cyanobacteria bacterium J06621_11]
MIAQGSSDQMTPEEYLAFEEKSPIKYEYIDGKIYAMSGTTDVHNTIAQNAQIALRSHLRGSGCDTYIADIKAQLPHRRKYYYPDVMVTCDPADRADSKVKCFPKLIVEVLSVSAEGFDRGDKFADYQTFESLEEYVLINTRRKRVEIFRRAEKGLWVLQTYQEDENTTVNNDTNVTVEFKSVDLQVDLSELYIDARLEDTKSETSEERE